MAIGDGYQLMGRQRRRRPQTAAAPGLVRGGEARAGWHRATGSGASLEAGTRPGSDRQQSWVRRLWRGRKAPPRRERRRGVVADAGGRGNGPLGRRGLNQVLTQIVNWEQLPLNPF
jgi:hypothetical protein